MSKTLFNQNTFQTKNVTNSDDVSDLKVDTFNAGTLTATTIVNTELQAATAGVATNTSAIATNTTGLSNLGGVVLAQSADITSNTTAITANGNNITANTTAIGNKQDTLSGSNLLNPNFISATDLDGDAVTISASNFGALEGAGGGADALQAQINQKAKLYDVTAPLVKTTRSVINFGENPILLTINNTSSVADGSTDLITSGGVFTGLAGKQATLSTGDGIDINGNTISFNGIIGQDITTSGTITGVTMNYVDGGVVTNIKSKIDTNTSAIATNTSAIATGTAAIAANATLIQTKQDALTSTSGNAGTNISISDSGVISATSGGTYTALANGGLAVNGSNQFSVDFSNTNATIQVPQRLEVINDTTTQLLVKPSSTTSRDAAATIRGARSGSTTNRQAQLRFENYDDDLSATNDLFEIAGKVTNSTTNVGGMLISNYADGSTRTENTTMSASGNWYFGGSGTFQDTYGVRVGGTAYFDDAVTFASTVTLTQPITTEVEINAYLSANQLLVDTQQNISTNGSNDASVRIKEGILLCDAGTGSGYTSGNGVIQINCRASNKLQEGICMRASNNNNNCINFRNTSDSARGRIDGDGSNNVKYRTSSDVRLKENIEDMESCWELLKTAQPRKFRWIEDQQDDVGFIAQEIYALEGFSTLKPKGEKYNSCDNSLNTFDEDGYCENPMESEGVIYPHALDYGNFTPYLWKALQEAITKIETLETKVAVLEDQLIV